MVLQMTTLTATYSPDDNKLRLYASARLDQVTYGRVKNAGFKWAPTQGLFVAPMWTPDREDLLIALAGEVGDEDTSLVDRAEERAERFEDYSERRAADAQDAHKVVRQIADGIPFGQPILVGHHSERRARKDAERIENGMRKAIRLWDTAKYWEQRAAGAVRAAKYKERPDVRARRMKGLEADKRKQERYVTEAETFLKMWRKDGLTLERAKYIANFDHVSDCFPLDQYPRDKPASQYEGSMSLWSALDGDVITAEQARDIAIPVHERTIEGAARWIAHYDNRLAYEKAMFGEAGGTAADRTTPEKGGACRCWASRAEWTWIVRVNKTSVTVYDRHTYGTDNFTRTIPFDKLTAVMPAAEVDALRQAGRLKESSDKTGFYVIEPTPTDEGADQVAPAPAEKSADTPAAVAEPKASSLPPLCNYPGDGFREMTAAEWKRTPPDCKAVRLAGADGTHGEYRYRTAFLPGGSFKVVQVYITDSKRVDQPAAPEIVEAPAEEPAEEIIQVTAPAAEEFATMPAGGALPPAPAMQLEMFGGPVTAVAQQPGDVFDAMREQLRQGIKVVAVPQLFATAPQLADRMVGLAKIEPGHRVCEPSAGTGNIVWAIVRFHSIEEIDLTAVEIHQGLADKLATAFPDITTRCGDFLTCQDLGQFDRIIMNPPFINGADIAHIRHAMAMLKPGGRLVAICANGTRQRATLQPFAAIWEDLPAGTFKDQGTNVNAALVVIEA